MTLKRVNVAAEQLTVDVLREALEVNGQTGALTWKTRPEGHFDCKHKAARWNGKYAGKPALTARDARGYARGCLNGVFVYAHRVILALQDGEWPKGEVDHINRDKADNRPANLRVVTHQQNRLNTENVDRANEKRARKKSKKINTFAGIRRGSRKKWYVRLKHAGKLYHLGSFGCFAQAVKARKSAQREIVL